MDALVPARRWTTLAVRLHGPARPQGIARLAKMPARLVMMALLVLLVTTTGCAPLWRPVRATPTSDCALVRQCRVVIPPCGPAVVPAPGNTGVWYYGRQLPRNVAEVAGFPPLLPTWFPTRASWDSALLDGPQFGPGQAPLLREVYALWPPRLPGDMTALGTLPDPQAAFVLDETTGTFGPLTGLTVFNVPLHIVVQRAVMVGGLPATLFHLAIAQVSPDNYQVIEVLWQDGSLALRPLASYTGGRYQVQTSDNPASPRTTILPGLGVNLDAALLEAGSTIEAYTGCIS
jgi:hypothetical protein